MADAQQYSSSASVVTTPAKQHTFFQGNGVVLVGEVFYRERDDGYFVCSVVGAVSLTLHCYKYYDTTVVMSNVLT